MFKISVDRKRQREKQSEKCIKVYKQKIQFEQKKENRIKLLFIYMLQKIFKKDCFPVFRKSEINEHYSL